MHIRQADVAQAAIQCLNNFRGEFVRAAILRQHASEPRTPRDKRRPNARVTPRRRQHRGHTRVECDAARAWCRIWGKELESSHAPGPDTASAETLEQRQRTPFSRVGDTQQFLEHFAAQSSLY